MKNAHWAIRLQLINSTTSVYYEWFIYNALDMEIISNNIILHYHYKVTLVIFVKGDNDVITYSFVLFFLIGEY